MSAFLEGLSPDERADLEALFEPVAYAAGERLFLQGDPAEGAFVIDEGEISLEMVLPGGARESIAMVGPGDFLGEPAWLDAAKRTLDARAVTPVRAKYMHAQDFRSLVLGFRPGGFHLTKKIACLAAERIRATEALIGTYAQACFASARCVEAEPVPIAFDPRPFLSGMDFFHAFTPREIDTLLNMGTIIAVPRGTRLPMTATSGVCHFVLRGAMACHLADPGCLISVLGPGRMHGATPAMLGTPSQTTIAAREDAILLRFDEAVLTDLFEPTSRLAYRFMLATCMELLRRLEQTNRTLSRTRRQADF